MGQRHKRNLQKLERMEREEGQRTGKDSCAFRGWFPRLVKQSSSTVKEEWQKEIMHHSACPLSPVSRMLVVEISTVLDGCSSRAAPHHLHG